MAPIFPKASDLVVKILGIVVGVGALSGIAAYTYYSFPSVIDVGYQPRQPVPYSHKLHAGELGLDCTYCHNTVKEAAFAALPATRVCMGCHLMVRDRSPRLEPVRQSYATGDPIEWVKIHDLPDYVYFNHSAHLQAGVSCVSCHGRIDQMEEVKQMEPLNMGWCLDCHRNPAPRIRPANEVTNLGWVPPRDPAEIGREIIEEKGLHPPTNCSGCHR